MRRFQLSRRAAAGLGFLLLAFLLYRIDSVLMLLDRLLAILSPFFLGSLIALIINLPMRSLERKLSFLNRSAALRRLKRPICLTVSVILLFAAVGVMLVVIIPQIAAAVENLIAAVPELLRQLEQWLLERNAGLRSVLGLAETDETAVREQFVKAYNFLLGGLNYSPTLVLSAAQVMVNAAVGLVFATYLLYSKERIRGQLHLAADAWLGRKQGARLKRVAGLLVSAYSSFIGGQCLQALISAFLTWLALLVFGVPYAMLVGLIVFVTAFIPIFGPYISGFIGLLLVFTADASKTLWFIVIFMTVQQAIGSLVYPRIMSSAVDMPSIWVLVAVTAGGGVMGVTGMLLAIPLAAVAYRLLAEKTHSRSASARQPAGAAPPAEGEGVG